MHVETKELPPVIVRALAKVGYGRKAIDVRGAESFSMAQGGGDGYRCFCLVVNLDTEAVQEHWGSWGGSNMFNPRNAVDLNTASYPLPPNGAVITGSMGGSKPVYASLEVHPSRLAKLLPETTEVPERVKQILACFRYKSAYRKAELSRLGTTEVEIDDLVTRGFIYRNRAGACQLTTAGRNAAGNL